MRRSAAPSQLAQAAKRPRFCTPLLQNKVKENEITAKDEKKPAGSGTGPNDTSTGRNAKDILKLISNTTSKGSGSDPPVPKNSDHEEETDITVEKTGAVSLAKPALRASAYTSKFKAVGSGCDTTSSSTLFGSDKSTSAQIISNEPQPPLKRGSVPSFKRPHFGKNAGSSEGSSYMASPQTSVNTQYIDGRSQVTPTDGGDACQSLYFAVMWCKKSARKHKKWEGDAILITSGRSVTLVDMDGKEIGKSTGYRTSELLALDEGNSLDIGGKEIEVMNKVSESDYKSGKCFQGATLPPSPPAQRIKESVLSKPFRKPQKPGPDVGANIQLNEHGVSIKPRFDPTAPNALVMPRPSQAHQWEHNASRHPLIDVVVDPYLSQHLRPHQREGVVFLYECVMGMKNYTGNGAILADEMGLGKTLQCITLMWSLFKQGPYGGKPLLKRVLVITPGSLVKNWCQEFKKWLGNERLKVFGVGPKSTVHEFIHSPMYPVMVISYEMFVRSIDQIKGLRFELIICDEGHRLKNTNIKTTTYVNSLSCSRRVILTGTPVQNDLQELYSIVDLCNPGILGSANAFKHVYEEPILRSRQPSATATEITLGEERAAELNRITGLFILRRTSDINNKYLPPKVELVMFCQPSDLQNKLYKKLLSSRVVKSCLMSSDSAQHLMCIAAMKKLCNHPSLIHKNAEETEASSIHDEEIENQLYQGLLELYPPDFYWESSEGQYSGKLATVDSLLSSFYQTSPQERVVLVSNYTQTLDILEKLCEKRGYPWLRLDGQTPTAKRQPLVERFNNRYASDFVFLLSSKAGGVGLNLIGASRLILYDIDWNPANDLQAMARVWRDGQKKQVYIYRLLTTGTIEEKIYQRQITKQCLSGVVVDARSNNKMQFSPDELRDLFKLQEETLCGTHDLLNCTCQTGEDRAENEEEEAEVVRPCQLQVSKKTAKKKKNLAMDELFEWKHIAGPGPYIGDVDHILGESTLDHVTYVFWNISNATESQLYTE